MLGVGIALGLFIWRIDAGLEQRPDKRIDRLADDRRTVVGEMSELRERMARVEGLLEGFLRRWDPDAPAAGQPAPNSP